LCFEAVLVALVAQIYEASLAHDAHVRVTARLMALLGADRCICAGD
jgi:hypothetical protein